MKIYKEYCYKTSEIPAAKMTRTFNALKRMNWVQNCIKGLKSNFIGISDRLLKQHAASPHLDSYRQYTVYLAAKAKKIEIANEKSVLWTLKFENSKELNSWISEHMSKRSKLKRQF